jgi:hypothetical protein
MSQQRKAAGLKSVWVHFDAERSIKAPEYVRILERNSVNISLPQDSTHWDAIYAIAKKASHPFRVKFLSAHLKKHHAVRGQTCFGKAGDQIQKILDNYPTLRWWMQPDGLVVDEPKVDLTRLSLFDRFAGEQAHSRWTNEGLPKDSLLVIAKQLDAEDFKLNDCLQPAQWAPIAKYNQKYAREAIRTFEAAAQDSRFVRGIRRRLHLARDRYRKARRSVAPIEIAY